MSKKQLEILQPLSLQDALKTVPGVNVRGDEVEAGWRKVYMTRDELVERFGGLVCRGRSFRIFSPHTRVTTLFLSAP